MWRLAEPSLAWLGQSEPAVEALAPDLSEAQTGAAGPLGQPLDVTLAVAVDFNGSAYRWTAESLGSFVWVDVLAWCQERELEPPSGVTTALAVLIDHLDASASLHPGSGRGDDLRAAARSLGGATARRRHPSQGTAAVLVLPVPTPAG